MVDFRDVSRDGVMKRGFLALAVGALESEKPNGCSDDEQQSGRRFRHVDQINCVLSVSV